MPTPPRLLDLARKSGILRACDLEAHGIPRTYLKRFQERGLLEQIGRGLYRLASADISEYHGLATAAKRVPEGVICLLSAIRFHRLSTQAPFEAWMAVALKGRTPSVDYPPLRIVRMAAPAREAGVDVHRIEGVEVKVFSAAKTVADCFKFRNKVGLEVALEALRDYWRGERRDADELWRMAKVCRVANVMRPYLALA